MNKIVFLKGLPASGKTTLAKKMCSEDPNLKRVNKDDIREELGNPEWSNGFEKKVLETQRGRGIEYLNEGFSIIIDDTNFHKKHTDFWQEIAIKMNVDFEEIFLDVNLLECIKRDSLRPKPVGEKIIRTMYNTYLKRSKVKIDERTILIQDELIPHCIICDIDGTLSLMNGRTPYDYPKVITDKVNTPVAKILERYREMRVEIIYVSGRDEVCRKETETWLRDNNLWFTKYQQLYMRKNLDFRADTIVKKELYENYIKDNYYIEFVLEDRDSVVKLWRELGLLCLQVYYGDF